MPLGSHDTGGTTTTTTPSTPRPTDNGVCAISPSDLVGYTGNLINRVNELEQRIAQLEAANLEVNQLSDISQQVGWVDGVTYMGIPGWTQTEYGTLIPPPGFTFLGNGMTLSDGNTYQAVYFDEDGVLQYGFQTGGTGVTGAAVASGATNYIVLTSNSTTISGGDPDMIQYAIAGSALSFDGVSTITANSTGLYRLSFFVPVIIANSPATAALIVDIGSIQIGVNHAVNSSSDPTKPGSGNWHFAFSLDLPLTAADEIDWQLVGCTVVSHSPGTNQALISVTKIG